MEQRSRRSVLKNVARAVTGLFGWSAVQRASAAEKPPRKRNATAKPGQPPLPFTSVVSYGNLLFVAGIGCPHEGAIEDQTNWVLDQIEKNLQEAGSSLQNVLKVNVFLEDIKMYDRMNAVYGKRNWGAVFPARNTVAPAALPGTDRGLAIDCIAYLQEEE